LPASHRRILGGTLRAALVALIQTSLQCAPVAEVLPRRPAGPEYSPSSGYGRVLYRRP
jgi:hypothetical protein